jgi:hypothetical protein
MRWCLRPWVSDRCARGEHEFEGGALLSPLPFRCHREGVLRVFLSFCVLFPRSVTAREVREVAGKVVVAPTGFESVFAVRHALSQSDGPVARCRVNTPHFQCHSATPPLRFIKCLARHWTIGRTIVTYKVHVQTPLALRAEPPDPRPPGDARSRWQVAGARRPAAAPAFQPALIPRRAVFSGNGHPLDMGNHIAPPEESRTAQFATSAS